jgi:hypothetical protein
MCTDPAAYRAIPDEFLECLMTRRHHWPARAQQHPQHVRMQADRLTVPLELTEYYASCSLCTTTRTLFRHRYDRSWAWAEYDYPDGYLAPPGTRWDPELIAERYDEVFPVKGETKVLTRP